MLYLALPYTHDDKDIEQQRFEQSVEAYHLLTSLGEVVLCPIMMSHPAVVKYGTLGDWETWKEIDLAYLSQCDELIVLKLPGWEESVGVKAELEEAKEWGINIWWTTLQKLRELQGGWRVL